MEDGTATATATAAMAEGEEGLAPASSAQANEVALSTETTALDTDSLINEDQRMIEEASLCLNCVLHCGLHTGPLRGGPRRAALLALAC
jgi:hypothetical protein